MDELSAALVHVTNRQPALAQQEVWSVLALQASLGGAVVASQNKPTKLHNFKNNMLSTFKNANISNVYNSLIKHSRHLII